MCSEHSLLLHKLTCMLGKSTLHIRARYRRMAMSYWSFISWSTLRIRRCSRTFNRCLPYDRYLKKILTYTGITSGSSTISNSYVNAGIQTTTSLSLTCMYILSGCSSTITDRVCRLIDFFRYYSRDFAYNTGVASIRSGLLKKDSKGWQNDLSNQRYNDARERNRLCIEVCDILTWATYV